jgi:acyl homoserine lactone synthase
MYRLRYRVFHERLKWDVQVVEDQEIDTFDDVDSVYLLATDDTDDSVCGGWRLRPTTRGYMLSDVFPELLGGQDAPRHRQVWEISRFAVDTRARARTAGFTLGDTARKLVEGTVRFALANQINRYVLVTSLAVERLLNGIGLQLHRFGPPRKIGNVWSIACWVDIDAHTCGIALGEPVPMREAA